MERWWRFDRSDYIVLRGLLLFAVLVSAAAPAFDLVAWLRREPLHWQSGTLAAPPAATDAVQGATGVFEPTVNWTFAAPTALQRFGAMLPGLFILVVVLLAVVSLWRLVSSLQAGAAFTAASVRAVRILGLALLGYVIVGWVIAFVADQLVMLAARGGDLTWSFTLSASDLALGLVAALTIALAEAFRQGHQLARDVEGLV